MEFVKIKVKRDVGAKMPDYGAYDEVIGGNTGADLFSNIDIEIAPMKWELVPTGLFVEVPPGVDMQIRSKSGMANNSGIFVLNSPGTVDPSYRGEVKVILFNLSDDFYAIKKGDKIAQAVFSPVYRAEFIEEETLTKTKRADRGFGKSGK